MSNSVIEKTSSEEGKYGEIIAECFYKHYADFGGTSNLFSNIRLKNTTKVKEYQKIDCDFIDEVSGRKIEVKHDTWICGKKAKYPNGTGNIPYEIATHVPYDLGQKILAYSTLNDIIKLDELLEKFPELHSRFIGCNEKCQADDIFAIGGEEESEENRRYKLKKIWNICNPNYQKYAHSVPIHSKSTHKNGEEWLHLPWQKEDKCYNVIINIPINNLVNLKIAREMPEFMINKMREKFPALNDYHTSQELEELVTTF